MRFCQLLSRLGSDWGAGMADLRLVASWFRFVRVARCDTYRFGYQGSTNG